VPGGVRFPTNIFILTNLTACVIVVAHVLIPLSKPFQPLCRTVRRKVLMSLVRKLVWCPARFLTIMVHLPALIRLSRGCGIATPKGRRDCQKFDATGNWHTAAHAPGMHEAPCGIEMHREATANHTDSQNEGISKQVIENKREAEAPDGYIQGFY
jgi:hypothetical protein